MGAQRPKIPLPPSLSRSRQGGQPPRRGTRVRQQREFDITERDQARFWAKVALPNEQGCMLWLASKTRSYGTFSMRGRPCYAHRFAYELLAGPIPAGLHIDHLCRTTECVRVDHLEPVTCAENIRRGQGGANMRAKTHCPQGHPYEGVNLRRTPHGARVCRTCQRLAARAYRRRLKEAA